MEEGLKKSEIAADYPVQSGARFSLRSVRLCRIGLKVPSMERSLAFYRDLLGFRESDSGDSSIALSSSTSMREDIILTEVRNARPRPRWTTGLFHVAMRLPHRSSLATLVR